MAGNGSSSRLKIPRIKNQLTDVGYRATSKAKNIPGDFHVGGCMSGPEKILYKESHLYQDGEGTAQPDQEGAVGLIPNAEPHNLSL